MKVVPQSFSPFGQELVFLCWLLKVIAKTFYLVQHYSAWWQHALTIKKDDRGVWITSELTVPDS